MILSRRSFLKVAGLSAVAVAGASMFTGCSFNNLFSTGVEYSADASEGIGNVVDALNKSPFANAVPGHSDLYSGEAGKAKCLEAVQRQLKGTNLLTKIPGAKDVEVASAALSEKKDENGKTVYFIKAVLSSRPF